MSKEICLKSANSEKIYNWLFLTYLIDANLLPIPFLPDIPYYVRTEKMYATFLVIKLVGDGQIIENIRNHLTFITIIVLLVLTIYLIFI